MNINYFTRTNLSIITLLSFIPTCLAILYFLHAESNLEGMESEVKMLKIKAANVHKAQAEEIQRQKALQRVDPNYVASQLESLPLRADEIKYLEALAKANSLSKEKTERLKVLKKQNHLRFTAEAAQKKEHFTETELCQEKPVEMDLNDLKTVLARVETTNNGAPELVVTEFDLSKKPLSSTEECYELQMKLIKREL